MSKILLDYFFPITSIEPTPQASTSFLKQVLVIGAPKDEEVETGVITLCTTSSEWEDIFGTDASAEVAELFAAGMNKAYCLAVDDFSGLDDILDGRGEFFTILITSDFDKDDIGRDAVTPAVKASLTTQKTIDDVPTDQLTFEAVNGGVAGNSITVEIVDDVEGGEEFAHATDLAITIHIEAGVSDATAVKNACDDSVSVSALVTTTIASGQDAVTQEVFAEDNLSGGAQTEYNDDTGIQLGTFKGVLGVGENDLEFLEEQATIANRCAFYTTTDSKNKNLFYAFGKMLSNALNWRNQQYITMPIADDVDTLGEANLYFDDKISFVISDDEFGERLALFAVGGKAIVAPYIKRNLEVDFQSAALSYISGNQPAYTKKQAALLEDELQKVIASYISREWIEAGVVEVLLEQDNFVASGNINIAEPKALWRIFGEMRQTL